MSDLGITRLEPLQIAGVDGDPLKLEELVDRRALVEMIDSFERLFNVPVRVVSTSGTTLAGTAGFSKICALVNEHSAGQQACAAVLDEVGHQRVVPISRLVSGAPSSASTTPPPSNEERASAPSPSSVAPISGVEAALPQGYHRCFTGAVYRVFSIEYDRRPIGQIMLGPYLPSAVSEPPAALLGIDPELDVPGVRLAFPGFTRVDPETIEQLGRHLATVLDVILFSGHKALLTSQMHLASIKESYRELSEKTEHLEEAYERLKELDRLKSNFLATVSHELRTPLTSIMGYGEMLAEGVAGELNEEQREFVETIRAKSEQLLGLIMSLLDLSKLESGTTAVRVGRVSLGAVLAETVSTLAPTAMKKGVDLKLDVPPDLPFVLGDAERLRQVFINLTDNAVKFTPTGGNVRLSARATMEQPSNEPGVVLVAPLRQAVEVRVIDTGIGIPEGQREKVFDAFYQIDQSSTREYGGAGLGLAIVRRLVEAHQGSVSVEANAPQGAVFSVWLPSARPSLMPPASRRTLPPVLG